jgi:hypothetical protein
MSDVSLEYMNSLGIEFPPVPDDVLPVRMYDGRQHTADPFVGKLFVEGVTRIVQEFANDAGSYPRLLESDGALLSRLEIAAESGKLSVRPGGLLSFSGPVLIEVPASDEDLEAGKGMQVEDLRGIICSGVLSGFTWEYTLNAKPPLVLAYLEDVELYNSREEIMRPRSAVLVPLQDTNLVSEVLTPQTLA